jgi:hypothetical protein
MESVNLNYNVPFKITESHGDNPTFLIEGVAINTTTTSNNHKFLSEELQTSANTLTGVPLLKDHNNSVDAIVGRVKEGRYNEETQNVIFKAQVIDDKMKNLIKQGVLNSVSVGADAMDIEESDDGSLIPKGIIFRELSLVAIPADSGATFSQALTEAYDKCKSGKKQLEVESKSEDNIKEVKGGSNMEENYATKDELLKLQEMIEAQTKLISEVLSNIVKEADADEVVEEPKEEPKQPEETKEVKEEVSETEESKETEEKESEETEESEEMEESLRYSIMEEASSLGGMSFSARRL